MTSSRRPDLLRQLLLVLSLLMLITGSLWVLRPFIAPTIWAAMITVATWPLLLKLQARLRGRRSLAAAVMLAALLLLFFVPLTLALFTLLGHADDALDWIKSLSPQQFAEPPAWVQTLPMVGAKVAQYWREAVQAGGAAAIAKLTPYAGTVARLALREVGALGAMALQFLLTVAICGVLYMEGEPAARGCERFAERLAGQRGVRMVHLAAEAVRGVALGVVVTAVAQALLAGIGLAVASVPGVVMLTTVMFLLCIAQIGPLPVLLCCCGWLLWGDHTGAAVGLLVWSGVVGTIDNFLRPWLIRMGADLPLLLIFTGVIGGLLAFGMIGLFVGPVVLAVTYTLLLSWMKDAEDTDAGDTGTPTPQGPTRAVSATDEKKTGTGGATDIATDLSAKSGDPH